MKKVYFFFIRIYARRPISLGVTMRLSEEEKFLQVFPQIVSSIIQRNDKFPNVPGVGRFLKEVRILKMPY